MDIESIEINDQFREAFELLEHSGKNVFITGRAGTGKSTLLEYFRSITGKNTAVLAPTGVAALNVKGQTIHSFFRFKPDITPDTVRKYRSRKTAGLYRELDIIIIDEISMVRADLLDCVDRFLKLNGPDEKKPFGGVQMVFIGDLYQLPPVVSRDEREIFESVYRTPYFYGAEVFKSFDMQYIELEKVYRQRDDQFITLLNAIRNNTVTADDLALLNSRYQPEFIPRDDDFYVYLTTTNRDAEAINIDRLQSLNTPLHTFGGSTEGDFRKEYLPTKTDLSLSTGCQIMMLNNDSEGRWVNGTIGKIAGFSKNDAGEPIIRAELTNGRSVEIKPYTWEIFKFYLNGERLQSEPVGRFTQYPVMLAWAVTIHKSQGKTFEKVFIDLGRGTFAFGQLYVALSRCTTLEGIVLRTPVSASHIRTNYHVTEFLKRLQHGGREDDEEPDEMVSRIRKAIVTKTPLRIVYLKPDNERSERTVIPVVVGTMGFRGTTYIGMQAYCLQRKEMRTFRLDRILEIK